MEGGEAPGSLASFLSGTYKIPVIALDPGRNALRGYFTPLERDRIVLALKRLIPKKE